MARKARSKSTRKRPSRGSGERVRYQKAVEAFEKAIKVLHKGDANRAQEQFTAILEAYPEEIEIADRARIYLTVCGRHLAPARRPKTVEDTVNFALMRHNEGDYPQAIKYLAKALEQEPKNDYIHYYLAAALARSGDAQATARHLKQAASSDPVSLVQAKADADFAAVRSSPEVEAVLSAGESRK